MSAKSRKRILHLIVIISASCCVLIGTSDPAWMAGVFRFVFLVIAMFAMCGMISVEEDI